MRLYHFVGRCAELLQHPSLADFKNYEKNLRNWELERTLMLYTELLKREMDRSCDRNQYRNLIRHLDSLMAYPSGADTARQLAACQLFVLSKRHCRYVFHGQAILHHSLDCWPDFLQNSGGCV